MALSKTETVNLGTLEVGNGQFLVIAGPCSIESYEQFSQTAQSVTDSGAAMIRGGMYKLRTQPHSFQGLGKEAFEIVKRVKAEQNIQFISEITDPRQISDFLEVVDVFQVGSRNMHNYALLKELGSIDKPVVLKEDFLD